MTPDYKTLDDTQAATVITEALQNFDKEYERRYAAIGLMAVECERRELWKFVQDPKDGFPCRSFARWVRVCCPHAFSTVYAAKADVESLKDVSTDAIAQIRESNFDTMKSLSTAVRRDPEVLEAAQGSNAGLVALVQKKHPQQAIERVCVMKLTLTTSQKAIVDEAIRRAKERGDASGPSQCVEMWAAAYLADCVLEDGYTGLATAVVQ